MGIWNWGQSSNRSDEEQLQCQEVHFVVENCPAEMAKYGQLDKNLVKYHLYLQVRVQVQGC